MTTIERWQRWGGALPIDVQANACAVLGVIEASPDLKETVLSFRAFLEDASLAHDALEKSLLGYFREKPSALDWVAPTASLLDLKVAASVWAGAWPTVAGHLAGPPRLRLRETEPSAESWLWFHLFSHAEPKLVAVTQPIAPPEPQLVVRWPLRIATMPINPAAPLLASISRHSWAGPLMAIAVVGRDDTNSDVLVHQGTAADLLHELRASRLSVKTDLLVLASLSDADAGVVTELVELTHASGFVLLQGGALQLETGLGNFLYELSHDHPCEVALFTGFVRETPAPAAHIGLTDALAALHVKLLAEELGKVASRPPVRVTRGAPPPPVAAPRGPFSFGAAGDPPLPLDELVWDHEHDAARTVARKAGEVVGELDRDVASSTEDRFLQMEASVEGERAGGVPHQRAAGDTSAAGGFIVGREVELRIHIGPLREGATAVQEKFPEQELPRDRDQWNLTVWLTEPDHLPRPLRQQILLPHTGPSSEARFRFTPDRAGAFEGRVTVLHRGRVLQTALLLSQVRDASEPPEADAAPRFEALVQVRRNLADLDRRREFDASFVFNKTTTGIARMVGLAKNHAFVTDLDAVTKGVQNIYTALSDVERSVKRYAKGLDDENGRAFLVHLAREGHELRKILIDIQLDATATTGWAFRDAEYLQIVHTKVSGIVPLEFIYDRDDAPEKDAKVCTRWRAALTTGRHTCDCNVKDRSIVCPLGFWGVTKVIERHLDSPALARFGGTAYLQSEPVRTSMTLSIGGAPLVAWSKRVTDPEVKPLIDAITQQFKTAPATPADWKAWVDDVNRVRPKFLLAMPHTSGSGASASLEIGGTELEAADLTEAHLRLTGGTPPLVALIGCDVSTTADDYAPHVIGFQGKGAAVVISTVATVLGAHAPVAANLLVNQLTRAGAGPRRLGEALRAVKQQALLDNLLMPLCLVAYGDADWQIAS